MLHDVLIQQGLIATSLFGHWAPVHLHHVLFERCPGHSRVAYRNAGEAAGIIGDETNIVGCRVLAICPARIQFIALGDEACRFVEVQRSLLVGGGNPLVVHELLKVGIGGGVRIGRQCCPTDRLRHRHCWRGGGRGAGDLRARGLRLYRGGVALRRRRLYRRSRHIHAQ